MSTLPNTEHPFYPDDTENPTTQAPVTPKPSGGGTKSTAAPPVGAPEAVPQVPPVSPDLGSTSGGLGSLMNVYHQLGLDKNYMAEAAKLLPTPPQAGHMTHQGWAALLVPALAAMGGGPLGMGMAGRAIGAAGLQQAANRQTDWQNRYKYATGLGTLANQMASQGRALFSAMAPYYGMRMYDKARIAEDNANRVQRAEEFSVSSGQRQQEIALRASAIAGQQESAATRNAIAEASQKEQQAYHEERIAIEKGNSALAAQKDAEAQYWHQKMFSITSKKVDAAISAAESSKSSRDRASKLSALRDLRAALQAEVDNAINSTTPDAQTISSLNDQIARVDTALNQMAGNPEGDVSAGSQTGTGIGGTPLPGTASQTGPTFKTPHGTYTKSQIQQWIVAQERRGVTVSDIEATLRQWGIDPTQFSE